MKICSIASGSKGNCLYLETGETRVLIDVGLSLRETLLRLDSAGLDATKINAVLITHEHIDHIRSAGSFARKFKVPVYASHVLRKKAEKYLCKAKVVEFEAGCLFQLRDISIDPFPITHDACDPVGFVLESNEGKCGTVTDLGIVTRLVIEKLRGCSALNLESNHDIDMLMNGPYPWDLKQRIKSRHGHLSNEDSLQLLHELAHDGLKALVMAHLSEVNNHPEHVVRSTQSFLSNQDICAPQIVIGEQYRASKLISI
ncbi:MAG: MBL fold metallo-hydrolase [Deltaproteobacteria bacterium]|nr:MBL fold metallo-hydrolase [Deltaproteobacteria bacterium]